MRLEGLSVAFVSSRCETSRMNTNDLYRLLRVNHVQAQGIVDTVSDPLVVLDSSLSVQAASRAFFDTFGVDGDETIGQPFYGLGNGQWDIPELRRLLEDVIPRSVAVINYQVEHDFPRLGRRTMLVTARTLQDDKPHSRTMLLTIVDATEQRRREDAKDLLFGEMRHRMKNLFGVAQSLARQTTTEGRSAEEYRDAFLGRFAALIDAEDLAFDEQEESSLQELLGRILSPYSSEPSHVVVEPGPNVLLKRRTITSLCLILHELATNAVKYGALSLWTGELRISWSLEDGERRLRFRWQEAGGPSVTAPAQTGYGTKLIKAIATYDLGADLNLDYAREGFRAEILIPLPNASPDA